MTQKEEILFQIKRAKELVAYLESLLEHIEDREREPNQRDSKVPKP